MMLATPHTASIASAWIGLAEQDEGFNLFQRFDIGVAVWSLIIFGLSLPLMIKFVFVPSY